MAWWDRGEVATVDTPVYLAENCASGLEIVGPAIVEFRVARTEDVYPWVLGGTALGDVLPDTPYEAPSERRIPAVVGPNAKDASDR